MLLNVLHPEAKEEEIDDCLPLPFVFCVLGGDVLIFKDDQPQKLLETFPDDSHAKTAALLAMQYRKP